jgi:hypothetical protein
LRNKHHQWFSDIDSDKCFFQLLIPGLTPVSLLERESGFEIITQLHDTGEQASSHSRCFQETPDKLIMVDEK